MKFKFKFFKDTTNEDKDKDAEADPADNENDNNKSEYSVLFNSFEKFVKILNESLMRCIDISPPTEAYKY